MANEIHSHGVQAILLVQGAHSHLAQVVSLLCLRVPLIIALHKPAARMNSKVRVSLQQSGSGAYRAFLSAVYRYFGNQILPECTDT